MADLNNIAPVKTRNLSDYTLFLRNFLLIGLLWERINLTFFNLLEAFAVEYNRNDQRNIDLQTEVIPGLSLELLTQWEKDVLVQEELPDGSESIAERQARVQSKLFSTPNNPTQKFWEDFALSRGVTIAITFPGGAFRVDVNRMGDRIQDDSANFVWIVDYVSGSKTEYSKLEATFRRLAPAWQLLIFNPPPP